MRYEFKTARGSLAEPPETRFRPPRDLNSIEQDIIEFIPESVAREHECLPLAIRGDRLHVAKHDVHDIHAQDKLRFLLNRDVRLHRYPSKIIRDAIDYHYGTMDAYAANSMLQEFTSTSIDFTEAEYDADFEALVSADLKRKHPTGRINKLSSFGRARDARILDGKVADHLAGGNQSMFFFTIREGQRALAYRPSG